VVQEKRDHMLALGTHRARAPGAQSALRIDRTDGVGIGAANDAADFIISIQTARQHPTFAPIRVTMRVGVLPKMA
jgi:hypothetical protein